MEERINQALVQLENDLQNISSAREQIEKTVGASVELQKAVTEYVTSVRNLCVTLKGREKTLREKEDSLGQDVESAIADIEQTCSTLIATFNANIAQATTLFQTGTEATLGIFADENNKLAEHVKCLDSLRDQTGKATEEIQHLKDTLAQISKDLKESQDEQDKSLNDIQQKVANLPSQVHEEALAVIQNVKTSETTIIDSVNNAISKANEIIDTARGISSNLDGVNTLCQNINSSIISSTTNLTNVITGAKNDVDNKLSEEAGILDSNIASVKSLCESIESSVESFSGQITSAIDLLKNNEQHHFDSIVRELEEQEKRLNTEFDVVRKQNKLYSIVIIVLLIVIGCLICFNGKI